MRRQLSRTRWFAFLLSAMVAALAVAGATHLAAQSGGDDTAPVMPRYDADGALHLPDDYLRWTFVGASLGLSYNDEPPQRESFNHTLMEPTAYDHFVRTGEFREGTMLVLLVRSTEADAMPARHGRFASDVLAVELAVKDKERVEAGWGVLRLPGRRQSAAHRAAAATRQPLLRVPHRPRGARQRLPAVLPAAGRCGRGHRRLTRRQHEPAHDNRAATSDSERAPMKFPSGHSLDTNTIDSTSMDSPSSATSVVVAVTSFPLISPTRELIVADSPSCSNRPNS